MQLRAAKGYARKMLLNNWPTLFKKESSPSLDINLFMSIQVSWYHRIFVIYEV